MIEPKVNYTQEQCRAKVDEFVALAAQATNDATWHQLMHTQREWQGRLDKLEERPHA